MINVKMKIGQMEISADLADMKTVHKFGSTYGAIPKACTACKSPNITLSHRHVGGNDYYSLYCGDCTANGNFGQYKSGGGLFWKREKMTVYTGDGEQHNDKARGGKSDDTDGDESPF